MAVVLIVFIGITVAFFAIAWTSLRAVLRARSRLVVAERAA